MNTIPHHHSLQEKQHAIMPELESNMPHQLCKQSYAKSHPKQTKTANEKTKEQIGFRHKRKTMEQIFTLHVLCEQYSQHHQDILHILINFKKALDCV